MSTQITVVISDSFQIVREGIAARLAMMDDISIVGEASGLCETLAQCQEASPDVLLMDFDLKETADIAAVTEIHKSSPNTKIVVMSSTTASAGTFLALSNGAVSFISKQAKGIDFVTAVQATATGYSYLPLGCLEEVLRTRKNVSRTGNAFGLSPREVEVLTACQYHNNNKDIAAKLNISVRTVETHRHNIYRKTDCSDQCGLNRISSLVC